MYLSKLESIFVQIGKCICPNCKKYLWISKLKVQDVFVQVDKYICPTIKISQVKIAKCLTQSQSVFLFKMSNVFVQIDKLICPNCKKHLSQGLYQPVCGISSIWIQPKFGNFHWH